MSSVPGILILDLLGRVTVVLAGAGLVAGLLRGRGAAVRHGVWAAALAGSVIMPVLMVLPGGLRWLRFEGEPRAGAAEMPRIPAETRAELPAASAEFVPERVSISPVWPAARGVEIRPQVAAVVTKPARRVDVMQVVAWIWGMGVAVMGLPLAMAWGILRGIARRGRAVRNGVALEVLEAVRGELGVRRQVRLMEVAGCRVPMTFGVMWPVIVVPVKRGGGASGESGTAEGEWTRARWRMILLHEMAHVRRWDVLMLWVGQAARAMYWFHPLAWVACGRAGAESERACDEMVMQRGIDAAAYAAELVEMAKGAGGGVMRFAAVQMAGFSRLERRVRDVLHGTGGRGGRWLWMMAVMGVGMMIVGVGMLRARAADVPGPPVAGDAAGAGMTAGQKAAAEAMRAAAQRAWQGVLDIEKIRPRTPEFLAFKMALSEKMVETELLVAPDAAARRKALEEHLKRTTDLANEIHARAPLDVTRASVSMADYAVAAATYRLAAELVARDPADKEALAKKTQAAADIVAAGQKAYAELIDIEAIRPRTPEFLELKLTGLRKVLEARLLAASDSAARRKALEEYLKRTTDVANEARGVVVDFRREFTSMADDAKAEAEYKLAAELLDEDATDKNAAASKARAATAMVTAAEDAFSEIVDSENIRARTPELLALKIAASQKLRDAELLAAADEAARHKALEDHLKRVNETLDIIRERINLDVSKVSLALAEYAKAEAEYKLATETAGAAAAQPAATKPAGANVPGARIESLEGLPIVEVEIAGNTVTPTEMILSKVRSQRGQVYSMAQVNRDVREITSLDRFAAVRAEALPMKAPKTGAVTAVIVRFEVEDRTPEQATRAELLRAALEGDTAAKKSGVLNADLERLVPADAAAEPGLVDDAAMPDGKIIRVMASGKVYINLTSKDKRIKPGLTFSVFDPHGGVHFGKDGAAKGIGTIEVVSVGESSTLCRVTISERDRPIAEGDLIASIVLHKEKGRQFHFVIVGGFDLDGDGKATAVERDRLIKMVRAWSGQVDNRVTTGTDYVVVEGRPSPPDPAEQATLQKQRDEAVKEAKRLGIPIMPSYNFLGFAVYHGEFSAVGTDKPGVYKLEKKQLPLLEALRLVGTSQAVDNATVTLVHPNDGGPETRMTIPLVDVAKEAYKNVKVQADDTLILGPAPAATRPAARGSAVPDAPSAYNTAISEFRNMQARLKGTDAISPELDKAADELKAARERLYSIDHRQRLEHELATKNRDTAGLVPEDIRKYARNAISAAGELKVRERALVLARGEMDALADISAIRQRNVEFLELELDSHGRWIDALEAVDQARENLIELGPLPSDDEINAALKNFAPREGVRGVGRPGNPERGNAASTRPSATMNSITESSVRSLELARETQAQLRTEAKMEMSQSSGETKP